MAASRPGLTRMTAVSVITVPSSAADADELADQVGIGQVLGGHLAGDAALLDDQHARRQRADEIEVLLDQHDGQAAAVTQAPQALDDLLDDRGLDALGRLIEQQPPGLAAE